MYRECAGRFGSIWRAVLSRKQREERERLTLDLVLGKPDEMAVIQLKIHPAIFEQTLVHYSLPVGRSGSSADVYAVLRVWRHGHVWAHNCWPEHCAAEVRPSVAHSHLPATLHMTPLHERLVKVEYDSTCASLCENDSHRLVPRTLCVKVAVEASLLHRIRNGCRDDHHNTFTKVNGTKLRKVS
jgi:hypothetical protein